MKSSLVILFLLVAYGIPSQELLVSNDPSTSFDFWLGEWKASWDEGNGKKGEGRNHIHKILDGKVIQEDFEILSGQSKGFKGISISTYQSKTDTWKQSWSDNQNGFYYFTGAFEGEKRMFQTAVQKRADGKEFQQRMVFYDIQDNSFTWDWESSQDGGKSWKLNWRIYYTRMKSDKK